MAQSIGAVSIIVRDYDEAKTYYTEVLGFVVVEDRVLDAKKRWLVVAPQGSVGTALLLAKAATAEQSQRIGDQAAGRVFLFLHTDDFDADYRRLQQNGVVFREEPRVETYGTVAVFSDLYGNLWDLIQLKQPPGAPALPHH